MCSMRSGLISWTLACLGLAACSHVRAADQEDREERHPIDHFSTRARFRAVFYDRTPKPGAAAWPAPGSEVAFAEVSCTVRETKTGRTARCVPGNVIDGAFAPLLRD